MKRKLLGALLSVAMAASLLVGCSGGGSNATAVNAGSDTQADTQAETPAETNNDSADAAGSGTSAGGKIGISMPTQSLERWNRDGAYLDEQFKAAGFETILTFSDNDSGRQVNDIQNMLADGVDLLIVAPWKPSKSGRRPKGRQSATKITANIPPMRIPHCCWRR